jgi:MFS family permease
VGFGIMAASLVIGMCQHTAIGQIISAACVTIGMCFIWPTLEALVSDSETAARLPNIVGLYNVVWAVTNAASYFIGGTLIEMFGYKIIYVLPLVVVLFQFGAVFWMQRHATDLAREAVNQPKTELPPEPHRPASPKAHAFLKMAWLANPFAYIAIQTLIAVIPGIAAKFHLTPMMAGFACTLWCFVRLGFFVVLWHWTDWHYRFRWLVAAFVLLILSFATILMAPNLAVLIVAQIFFGGAIGLIYYSSLFYSMDAGGETRGEHGGVHEAAIGLGNCVGPVIGAAAIQWAPGNPHSGAIAVSALLLCGLGGLIGIWKTAK